MIITNPTLTIVFTKDDLPDGRSLIQTISERHIIKGSIAFSKELLNGLKSSSNQVSLSIDRKCESIADIIRTEGDIKAYLKDENASLFTGYISTDFSWSVRETGAECLSITIEDVGTRMLKRPFVERGEHFFMTSADSILREVCRKCSVPVSQDCIVIESQVARAVTDGESCADILSQMLYELGYAYYFNADGELEVFLINPEIPEEIITLDSHNLIMLSGKAVEVRKRIRQYKAARVSFKTLGTKQSLLVYSCTQGQGSGVPYCLLEIRAGEWFDGEEVYSLDPGEMRDETLIEACNASSETESVGSCRIISVINPTWEFRTPNPASFTFQCRAEGGKYISILAHNISQRTENVTRCDVWADVVFERTAEVVRAKWDDAESSENTLDEEMTFIHTREEASKHANMLLFYHKSAGAEYSFQTRTDIALGQVVRLHDDVFSGLDVNVLLVSKSYGDSSSVVFYKAVGITGFNLDRSTTGEKNTIGHQTANKGIREVQYYYAVTSQQIEPNPADITSPVILPISSDSKYLWRKEVIVFTDDSTKTSVSLLAVYGDTGDGTPELTVMFQPSSYDISQRGVTLKPQSIRLSFTRFYISDQVSVELDDSQGEDDWVTISGAGDDWLVSIAQGFPFNQITFTASCGSIFYSYSIKAKTVEAVAEYLGKRSTPPLVSLESAPLMNGDYFLTTQNPAQGFYPNTPYVFANGTWTALDSSMLNYASIMGSILADALEQEGIDERSPVFQYLSRLAANEAFIRRLFANEIVVKGTLQSENYVQGESGFKLTASTGKAELRDATIGGVIESNALMTRLQETGERINLPSPTYMDMRDLKRNYNSIKSDAQYQGGFISCSITVAGTTYPYIYAGMRKHGRWTQNPTTSTTTYTFTIFTLYAITNFFFYIGRATNTSDYYGNTKFDEVWVNGVKIDDSDIYGDITYTTNLAAGSTTFTIEWRARWSGTSYHLRSVVQDDSYSDGKLWLCSSNTTSCTKTEWLMTGINNFNTQTDGHTVHRIASYDSAATYAWSEPSAIYTKGYDIVSLFPGTQGKVYQTTGSGNTIVSGASSYSIVSYILGSSDITFNASGGNSLVFSVEEYYPNVSGGITPEAQTALVRSVDILPFLDNIHDLGSAEKRWHNLHTENIYASVLHGCETNRIEITSSGVEKDGVLISGTGRVQDGIGWITKDMLMADKLFWLPYIAAGRIVVKNPGSGSSGVYYFRTPWSYYRIGLNVGSYGNYIIGATCVFSNDDFPKIDFLLNNNGLYLYSVTGYTGNSSSGTDTAQYWSGVGFPSYFSTLLNWNRGGGYSSKGSKVGENFSLDYFCPFYSLSSSYRGGNYQANTSIENSGANDKIVVAGMSILRIY